MRKIVFTGLFLLGSLFLSAGGVSAENISEVWGFLPSWRLTNSPSVDKVNKLFFFSIPVKGDGSLEWSIQSKRIYSKIFAEQAKKVRDNGGRVGVVFAMLKDKDLDKFLNNKEAWNKFFDEVDKLEGEIKGNMVNIDFEYQRRPTEILNENFFEFLTKARERMSGEMSVDVYGNTLILGSEDKVRKLFDKSDRVVFMGYDFNKRGFATPVAPLEGMVGADLEDVFGRVNGLGVPKGKFVVALPLYGYEWRTRTSQFGSEIHPYSVRALATMGRMLEFVRNNANLGKVYKIKYGYDEVTQTPWLSYVKSGRQQQIYYENERSLRAKVDRVKKYGYGAIAWWALGYEGGFDIKKVL